MDDTRIRGVIKSTDEILSRFLGDLRDYTGGIRSGVRDDCALIRDEVSFNIALHELHLVRTTVVISRNAEYHILRAYFHASPSLWTFIVAVYEIVTLVIGVINTINSILQAITGERLAYWLDKMIPGFEAVWNNLMNKISFFSETLGWGVDGIGHLMNAFNVSTDLWGMVTGKHADSIKIEKIKRFEVLTKSFSEDLSAWENAPGQQLASLAEHSSALSYWDGYVAMHDITDKIVSFGDKAEKALGGIGTITNELLGIRNDMPALIAQNIPPGIWNALELADTTINDRILPALTGFTDRLDELDAVLDSYQKKAAELAERLAHPGDLLAEIDKLPDYVRSDQLVKIDGVTSALLKEGNEAAFAAVSADLAHFGVVAAALQNPPPPLAFMELELPGRSPGIVAEPYETWILKTDY